MAVWKGTSTWQSKTTEKSYSENFLKTVCCSWTTWWNWPISLWSTDLRLSTGVSAIRSMWMNSTFPRRNLPLSAAKPLSSSPPDKISLPWTQKTLLNTTEERTTEPKSFSFSKRSSPNGSRPSKSFWMTTATPRKKPPTSVPDLSWTTGDKECKKSPTKVSSLRAETSNRLKTTSWDTRTMTAVAENRWKWMKTSPNWSWNIPD